MDAFKNKIDHTEDFAARVRAATELILVLERKLIQWGHAMEALQEPELVD